MPNAPRSSAVRAIPKTRAKYRSPGSGGTACPPATLLPTPFPSWRDSRANRHLFCGANRDTSVVYPFSRLNVAGCDLVSDRNVLREHRFVSINDVAVAGPYGRDNNEHVVVTMDSQQFP